MKIESYKKTKNNKYKIFISNGEEYEIYEDVIIKNNLLLKNEIEESLLNKILGENDFYYAYYLSVKYIMLRLRSINELKKYLIEKEIDKEIINKVINRLEKEKYLDDERFVVAYINTKKNTTNQGPNKIISDLRTLGINKETIEKNRRLFTEDFMEEKIKKIIFKEIRSNKKYGSVYLKNKIINRLLKEGYDYDIVNELISSVGFEDDINILRKEYEKLKNMDEKTIKNKLFKKGFLIQNIEKIMQ